MRIYQTQCTSFMTRVVSFTAVLFALGTLAKQVATAQDAPDRIPSRQQRLEIDEDLQVMASILKENLDGLYLAARTRSDARLRPSGQYVEETALHTAVDFLYKAQEAAKLSQSDSMFASKLRAAGPEQRLTVLQRLRATETVSLPLATYVPGFGAIFQAEIPAPNRPHVQEEDTKVTDTPSRWQRVREKLQASQLWAHGKWMTRTQCNTCHEVTTYHKQKAQIAYSAWGMSSTPSSQHVGSPNEPNTPTTHEIKDSVIDALFENGSNLRLAKGDRVCIELSYRRQPSSMVNRTVFESHAMPDRYAAEPQRRGMLPGRISLTVPKTLLTKAETTQISREEFADQVAIDQFDPDGADGFSSRPTLRP